ENGGGYLVWLWLREARPLWYGLVGALILVAYGIIPTLQKFPFFGRVYAAYGGVFIVLAVLWGWLVDKKTPDLYDWLGAGAFLRSPLPCYRLALCSLHPESASFW
uniref:YnfA family protein n=1 Tax=Paenibacillus sonchi TaxID=373687 RepID=UPI001FD7944E